MSITIPKFQKKPDKKTEMKRSIIADTSKVGNLVSGIFGTEFSKSRQSSHIDRPDGASKLSITGPGDRKVHHSR